MFAFLGKFLSGPIVNGVIGAYKAKLTAANDGDRIAADVAQSHLLAEIESRKAQRDIIIAEQSHWSTRLIRPMFAWPLAIYWAAIIADSMYFHSQSILALPSPMDEWAGIMVLAYFGGRPIEKIGMAFVRQGRK